MASPTRLRPPGARDSVLLMVAVLAVSTSAPIIAATVAPALAVAFWRCALGAAATLPWALRRARPQPGGPGREVMLLLGAAGALLAVHFALWIPSVRLTSVASAVALVSTLPVWTALLARATGVRIEWGAWLGIVVAVAGVVALTGIDFVMDPAAVVGDALALGGGVAAAAYMTVGERVRQTWGTAQYTATVYAVAAAVLLPMCLVAGAPLWGYSARDWALIVALTLLAQLLGHTLVNAVLRTTSATVVSLALLFEVPGAVLIAAVWLGVLPPLQLLPALVLLLVGLWLVVRSAHTPDPGDQAGL